LVELLLSQTKVDSDVDGGCEESKGDKDIQRLREKNQRLNEENQRLVELLLSQTKVDSDVDGGCEESKGDEDECKE